MVLLLGLIYTLNSSVQIVYWGKNTKATAKYPCTDYPDDIEKKKLKNLTDLIQKELGVIPTWYRAARFGADENTIQILQELGYQYDSSVTPHINWTSKGGPNHSKAPAHTYKISKKLYAETDKETDFSGIRKTNHNFRKTMGLHWTLSS